MLQKAYFWVELPKNGLERFDVQFNPTEMTFAKSVQLAEIGIPGIGATSVTTLTDRFYSLVKINSETHAPPICQFAWNAPSFPGANLPGNYAQQQRTSFRCLVESVSQKFTLFTPQGIPLRATLTVALREYKSLERQLKELNLQSPDHTKSHVIQRGETLSGIAGEVYDAPGEWRQLALQNDISDVRRLMPGRVLEVPPIS
jgi:nucleoid-associated protein YgaU